MAVTTKTLTPTNEVVSLPDMTEKPNASVLVDGIGKEADAINELDGKINTFVKSKTFSVTTANGGCIDLNSNNLGYNRTQCLILGLVTNITTGDTVYAEIGVYRASTSSWTIRFKQGNNAMADGVTFNLTVWYVLL